MTTTPPGGPTTPPDDAPQQGGPRVSRDELRDLARLRRTTGPHRHVAGVAGGVARHLDIDPAIARVVFVVLAFFGGSGVLLYLALWLLLPEDGAAAAPMPLDDGTRSAAVIGVGVVSLLLLLGDTWGPWSDGWFPWPLMLIAVVVAYVLSKRRTASGAAPGTVPPGTPAGPPYGHPGPPYGYPGAPAAYGAPGGVSFTKSGPQPAPYAPVSYATPPVPPVPPVPPMPPRPRRPGPILFGWTLALLALGLGCLGMADVGGAGVADSAYPALALALIATMLLVGAWYGRAGGLILIGLIAAVVLGVTTIADEYDGTIIDARPQTAAEVDDSYDVGVGELVLDLSEVADPTALAGRTIRVEGGAASLQVILPDGVDVQIDAAIGGPGEISLLGQDSDGIDISRDSFRPANDLAATPSSSPVVLDISLNVGEIVVTEAGHAPAPVPTPPDPEPRTPEAPAGVPPVSTPSTPGSPR